MKGPRRITLVLFLVLVTMLLAPAGPGAPLPTAAGGSDAPNRPRGPSADWWTAVQEGIRRSEYQVTWQTVGVDGRSSLLPDVPAAYQAPNRAQGLRTYFTPEGIWVIPRTGTTPVWQFGLALTGYGNAGAAQVLAGRIEYWRESADQRVSEWYVNDEDGLEQGFTISRQQYAVGGQPAPLVLELAISGGLMPQLASAGTAIEFRTASGETVLRYSDPRAADAVKRALPVRLGLASRGGGERPGVRGEARTVIQVIVDTTAASFPLTVTSRLTSPASGSSPTGLPPTPNWTAGGGQINAYLGFSAATAGDVNGDGYADIIVGAYAYDNGQTDEGAAFVYQGSPAGLTLTPAWMAEGDQASAYFGYAVGTAGDVNGDGCADVIVGAEWYDNAYMDEGAAFVYQGSPAGLGATPAWTAEGGQDYAYFAFSVGTAGDINGDGYDDVVVGAWYYDTGLPDAGAAFAYYGSAAGLHPSSDWTVTGDQANAHFGVAVGTTGDVNGDTFDDVIIGAEGYDNGQMDEGRAYVYHGSTTGLSLIANWTAEANQAGASFGWAVGAAGDVDADGYGDAVVGAPAYDNGQTNEGRAYLYRGSPTGLQPAAAWTAEGDQAYAAFGRAVGTAGDVNGDGYADVIVGAPDYDGSQTDEGAAYVYQGAAAGLSATASWMAQGGQKDAHFATAVARAGDVNGDGYSDVIVGAPYYDVGLADEGAALVYHGAAAGLATSPAWTLQSNQAFASLGAAVGTAGDVNGDGYADVIVGAYLYDNGQSDEGAVFAYYGSPGGLPSAPTWMAEGDQATAQFGYAVGTAGDVNGDGYADVIVGAPYYDNDQTNEGRAYAYYGSPAGLSPTPAWTAESDQAEAGFGNAVSTVGDMNGDGLSDVVVGAYRYDDGETDEGAAFVYQGSAVGLSLVPVWTGQVDLAGAEFGYAVGTAGDVNGDSYSDVIVGADSYDNGQTDEGAAFVYFGSPGGLPSAPTWMAEAEQASAAFGFAVGTAGDVNGDGYADAIVGAYAYTGTQPFAGAAFVYHGSAGGLPSAPSWTVMGDQASAYLGYAVGTAGDVNGDGYADVVVGAPAYDNGSTNEGQAYVYLGSVGGLASTPNWTAEGNQVNAYFASAVGTAGDVNGDGYADVLVGAPYYDNAPTDEGWAFLYYGNDGDGLDLRPRQMRTDGSAPIAPLGVSNDPSAVQLHLTGHTPAGRGQVKVEWQVALLGEPFTATTAISGTSAAWTDVLTRGVVITQNVADLEPGHPFHWRVRLLYHPANWLGQSAGRWLTIPWNGWMEQDLRTPDQAIAGLQALNDSPTPLGQPTTLRATITAGSNVTYSWSLGDETWGSEAVLTHTYPAVGVYTAVVTASNVINFLTDTTVVVVDEAIAGLSAWNDSPTVLGNPTAFTATITAGTHVSYTWSFGNGATAAGAILTYTYPAAGLYNAVVTASNSVGLVTATTPVTVDEPIAGLVATNDSPTALGRATTLTATVAAGSNVTYAWDFGDGGSGNGAVVTHTYPSTGTYTVAVVASNTANTLTATTAVSVYCNPASGASFTWVPSVPAVGTPILFTAMAEGTPPLTFQWTFGDGQTGVGITITHIYALSDTYNVALRVTNACGQTDVVYAVKVVRSEWRIYLPMVLKF